MRRPILSRYSEHVAGFCRKYHVVKLAIFGSFLTTSFTPASDIDFLVQFEESHIPT